MRKIKKISNFLFRAPLVIFLLLVLSNLYIIIKGSDFIHASTDEITPKNVALVLGTSKSQRNGDRNPFFYNRINAAFELYEAGKVKHFILSGDNREKYYNEPMDMKKALMELGVPDSLITLDYAGLSTLDSVVRAKLIFGQDNILVVTQKFHSYRTIFLCHAFDVNAEVYLAASIPVRHAKWVHLREFFARPRAILDVYLIHRTPKHLGEKIDITKN